MDEIQKVSKPEKKNGFTKPFTAFKEFIDFKISGALSEAKIALFTHPSPDPDALGSMMGVAWLLKKQYGVESDMFVCGCVSHPQNIAMVNLLSPTIIPVEEFCPEEYTAKILLDVIPSNAGRGGRDFDFDVIFDHHLEPITLDSKALYVNLHTGSNCATIYQLIKFFNIDFEETEEHDQRVATALMVGIYTDTNGLLSDRMTDYDHDAFRGMFQFRDTESLHQIAHFKIPPGWVSLMADAALQARIEDGVAVVGLGMISSKQRDVIPVMANTMLTWEGVRVAIAYGVVDGECIQGSVRSESAQMSAAKLSQEFGRERGGSGWGHADMGGYRYPMGGFSIQADDDQSTKDDTWKLCKSRETSRIIKLLKK